MKKKDFDRREFLKLSGIGAGAVFASSLGVFPKKLGGNSIWAAGENADFYFLQLSDTHWGFEGPKVNPEAKVTLKKAIQTVNSLKFKPDFIVFTGDLTHTTDDDKERRRRLREFKEIVQGLEIKNLRFLPGEHDASLDEGLAYKEVFGETYYTFTHKGIHFIALDNVSDPAGNVGDVQRNWLKAELNKLPKDVPIVVLTHRPLFDLMPDWDWATKDGKQVVDLLMPYKNVVVFYGHIHQENHHMTGHISHHSAQSLIFPLPAPGSVPKKAPIPWDAAHPFRGLGFRSIEEEKQKAAEIKEWPVVKA
ncbi:MAG: serine/threonine protein phosphatase [Bacteriovoracaceae bacterium]|nr:serine/threonine protein phosphatase [Bacteriovoracaceae bacterium]